MHPKIALSRVAVAPSSGYARKGHDVWDSVMKKDQHINDGKGGVRTYDGS